MIHAKLSHSDRYESALPGLDQAFAYLRQVRDNPPADGRYPIDGDRVFAIVASYETKPQAEKVYEGHFLYADVQFLAGGGPELIYFGDAEAARITERYDGARDFVGYDQAGAHSCLVLEEGWFAVFFPEDAHQPGVQFQAPSQVKKIVVKVRLAVEPA